MKVEEKVPVIVSRYFNGQPFVINEVYVRHEDRETGYWTKRFYFGKTLDRDMLVTMRLDNVRSISFRLTSDWNEAGRIADFTIEEIEANWNARSADKPKVEK